MGLETEANRYSYYYHVDTSGDTAGDVARGDWHTMCLLQHAAKESRNHPLEGFKDFRERKNEKEPKGLFVD